MERGHVPHISDLELFAECTRSEQRQISSLSTLLYRSKDQNVICEGRAAEEFILIGRGRMGLTRKTIDGVTQVAEVGIGEPLGVADLLTGGIWTVTATALTDVALFVSSASEFRAILGIAPSVERKLWRTLGLEVPQFSLAA